jgi:hypothetical protein
MRIASRAEESDGEKPTGTPPSLRHAASLAETLGSLAALVGAKKGRLTNEVNPFGMRRLLVATPGLQQGVKIRNTKRVVVKFQEKLLVDESAQRLLIPVGAGDLFPCIWLPRRVRQYSRLGDEIPRGSEVVRRYRQRCPRMIDLPFGEKLKH